MKKALGWSTSAVPCGVGTVGAPDEQSREAKGEGATRKALTPIATAVLFAGLLSGCASQGGILGRTVPRGTESSAGYEVGGASPVDPARVDQFGAIIHAPSAFDCQAERANDDVFERQCASNVGN
jgi:hypothetical protein